MIFRTPARPLDFFSKKFSAVWSRLTRSKYERAMHVLFADAQRDSDIELVIVTCRRGQVQLYGVRDGKQIKDKIEFCRILRPVVSELVKYDPAASADSVNAAL